LKSETKWYGLPKDSFYQLINIFTEYSTIIDKVILFGSRARGDYHLSSDIDLAIKFKNKNEELLHISDRLSEANIIYTLDVMDYDKISNSVLIDFIDKEGIVIFSTNSSGKSWKLMKSYLEYTGVTDLSSPRSTIKAAFKVGLITDGELWLKMLEDRNRTPHTYDESTALDIYNNIKNIYITLLDHACKTLEKNISRD